MTSALVPGCVALGHDEAARSLGTAACSAAAMATPFALAACLSRDQAAGWALIWFVAALGILGTRPDIVSFGFRHPTPATAVSLTRRKPW
jgi:hypothetical protein